MMGGNNGYHNNGDDRHKALSENGAAAMKSLAPSLSNTREDVAALLSSAQRNLAPFLDGPDKTEALIAVLDEIVSDPNSRQRVRAAEVLVKAKTAAVDQAVKIAEVLDKAGRLDRGEATERTVYEVEMPEARNRIAE
jgi:broad specificity phosphatase PhoE